MLKMTKRTVVKIIIFTIFIAGFVVFIRDLNGVRLLLVSPKILKYRPIIQEHAVKHQLDWRLITALIVQESGFNERAVSSAGAKSLMQLMPDTAKELGVTDPFASHESIAGATRYLRSLYDLYPESPHPDRIRIALASYNGGRGHIKDAQQITEYQNLDSHKWDSLKSSLVLLTERDKELHKEVWGFAKPPHGYFNGYNETRNYVKRVMRYYDRLCFYSGIVRSVKSFLRL